VVSAGYNAAFLTLAGVAAVGLLLFWFAMPETRDENDVRVDRRER
jgi:predicted MFS family arabinose efflux permease